MYIKESYTSLAWVMLVSEINVPMNMFGRTMYVASNMMNIIKKCCFLSSHSNENFNQISTFYSVDFFIY